MTINDDLRELILAGGTAIDIKKKAMDGVTTIEEVVRETVL
jgi:hypothetical protein